MIGVATTSPSELAHKGGSTHSLASEIEIPECVRAAVWVSANSGNLPRSLPALSAFSLTYRRAIFAALPASDQVAVWREHLLGFLRPTTSLTLAQWDAIRFAESRLGQLFHAERSERPALLADLEPRLALFEPSMRKAIFHTLGPTPSKPARATGSLFDSSTVWGIDFFTSRLAVLGACECNIDYQDCTGYPPSTERVQQNPHCSLTEQGCGPFWQAECNGDCAA